MSRRSLTTIVAVLLMTAAAVAQQPVAPSPIPQPAAKPGGDQPAPPQREGQAINVKLDFTITDQTGPGEPAKKTVSMIVADRSAGSIRSSANNVRAVVNVDATPQILPNGNIRVQLGLEYNPRQNAGAVDKLKAANEEVLEMIPHDTGGSALNQRATIVLEPGKPLVLSQAADPISDRKITVEVRAAILK